MQQAGFSLATPHPQQPAAGGGEGGDLRRHSLSVSQVPILHGHGPEKEGLLKFGMSSHSSPSSCPGLQSLVHTFRKRCPKPPEESWGSVPGSIGSTLLTLAPCPQPWV